MILYLDTSDLFKLYIREADSPRVDSNVAAASRLASSRLAFVEMRAAFAKARRDGRIPDDGRDDALYVERVAGFGRNWLDFVKVNVTSAIIISAGEIAERHGLRAGDAIHLASAISLRDRAPDEVHLSVADRLLRSGAVAEGFVVV